MNDFQERVAQLTAGTSGIGRAAVAFAREGAKVAVRTPEFSLFNQGRVQENSKELLRQGTLIANFLRGHW
jgi:NAD(P)-dependent dehydrogenase (short-subunit alcohol dehydrogenase family)